MKLTKVQITNFRSISDSTEFTIGDVTCLVGKNESGKTAVLKALHKLKPFDSSELPYDKDLDYPRSRVSRYSSEHSEKDALVLETQWTLSADEVSAIEETIGEGSIRSNEVTIKKRYGKASPEIVIVIDFENAIKFVLRGLQLEASDNDKIKDARNTSELYSALIAIETKSPAVQLAIDRLSSYTNRNVSGEANALVWKRVPSFLYFDSYDRMSGVVSLSQLATNKSQNVISVSDRVFENFLEFAGTTAAELSNLTTFEPLRAKIEGASNAITDQIFEYWSQNQFLRVQIVGEAGLPNDPPPYNNGMVVRTRIYNELHKVTVGFDDRSAGFVWFFSFLVVFSQVQKSHGDVIILLDEPGLNLHGRAQGDLLRFISEKLKPNHQVIYTTHSPFMVPPNELSSVRTVEDVVEYRVGKKPISHGTKVGDSVLSTDADTLFPLQGALGYEITQSLFIGANTLLVEGPGDVLAIQAVSEELRKRNREGLDARWAICPVNGIGKISAFVSLFGANKLNVAVLTDYSNSDKQQVERARRILQNEKVFTANTFVDQAEADLEDLFGPVMYAAIINGAYGLSSDSAISQAKIAATESKSERIVKRVEELFTALPNTDKRFDHFAPTSWLIQHPEIWVADEEASKIALDNFEALFKAVNSCIA